MTGFPAFGGTDWLIASNGKVFDADAAFDAMSEINWSESPYARIARGDVVYLYGTKPLQAITHRCLVVDAGLPFEQRVDDGRFWTDPFTLEQRRNRTWMRLQLLHTFDDAERTSLSLDVLTDYGLKKAPQGRMRVPSSVSFLVSKYPLRAST